MLITIIFYVVGYGLLAFIILYTVVSVLLAVAKIPIISRLLNTLDRKVNSNPAIGEAIANSIMIICIFLMIFVIFPRLFAYFTEQKAINYESDQQKAAIYQCTSLRDELPSKEIALEKLDQEWKEARDNAASLGISNSEFTKDKIREYQKATREYEQNK